MRERERENGNDDERYGTGRVHESCTVYVDLDVSNDRIHCAASLEDRRVRNRNDGAHELKCDD